MNPAQCEVAQHVEMNLLARLRPNAVGLVDAFEFSDRCLQSCLGAYDGNVYERMYDAAKRAPLNKTEVTHNVGFNTRVGYAKALNKRFIYGVLKQANFCRRSIFAVCRLYSVSKKSLLFKFSQFKILNVEINFNVFCITVY